MGQGGTEGVERPRRDIRANDGPPMGPSSFRSFASSERSSEQALFANADPVAGLADGRRLAVLLRADHPDAAVSLLEGPEEMFTVARLGDQRDR